MKVELEFENIKQVIDLKESSSRISERRNFKGDKIQIFDNDVYKIDVYISITRLREIKELKESIHRIVERRIEEGIFEKEMK